MDSAIYIFISFLISFRNNDWNFFSLLKKIFIVIQLQLYTFSPHPSTLPQPNPSPFPTSTLPLDFVLVSFSGSCKPLSSLAPPHSPVAIVRLFLTSMSLVIFCLLFSSVDYVPVKGEIIWYLSLTAWLISLSIILSSSIHAVAKVWTPSFSLLQRIPLCKCTIVFWSTHSRHLFI